MTGPLPDTWHIRDLPVLRAAVAHIDQTGDLIETGELAAAVGMDVKDVQRAILALHRGGYVKGDIYDTFGGTHVDGIVDVAEKAYVAAGAWPSPVTAADRMIDALERLAESGTEDERTRARKILDSFGGAGRDLAINIAAAAIGGQLG